MDNYTLFIVIVIFTAFVFDFINDDPIAAAKTAKPLSPAADRIEALQREARRIDRLMTAAAGFQLAMLVEQFP